MLQGVVVDDAFHTEGKSKRTHYTFIPTENMTSYKEAEKNNDRKKMTELSSIVDIEEITWGAPIQGNSGLVRETDLTSYLCALMRKKKEDFKEIRIQVRLRESNYYPDIVVERRKGKHWQRLIIEVKSYSTFTPSKLEDVINKLMTYRQIDEQSSVVLFFPGILPNQDNELLSKAGIEVWDVNFIASTFADEVATIQHPILQELFRKANYVTDEDKLIRELKSIQTGGKGENEWARYQEFIQKILDHLFGKQLSSPIVERPDYFRVNRRDLIMRNYAESGFWAHLRHRYFADYIVVDTKNYSKKIGKKEVLQIANYLKIHGPGLFALLFSRNGGDNSCYHTCREIWAMEQKLVIVLNDSDLERMIIANETSQRPEEIIRQRIEEFRLSM